MANQHQERKVPVLRSENSLIEQEFDSIRDKFELEMRKMEQEMSRFRSQLIASEKGRLITSLSASMSTSSSSAASSKSRAGSSMSNSGARQDESASETTARQQAIDGMDTNRQQASEAKYSTDTSDASRRLVASDAGSSTSSALSSSSSKKKTSSTISTTTTSSRTTTKSGSGHQSVGPGNGSSQQSNVEAADSDKFQQMRLGPDAAGARWLDELNSPLIKDSHRGGRMLQLRFDVSPYEPEQIVVKTIDNRLQIHARREEESENTSTYREYNREFLLPAETQLDQIRSSLSADGILTVEAPLPSPIGSIEQAEGAKQIRD